MTDTTETRPKPPSRWRRATRGGGDALAQRLSADTGIDFSALRKAGLGRELGDTLSALGVAALGLRVTILVGVTMVVAYIFLLVPNAHHLRSAWAAGLIDVLGFVWFFLGALFLSVSLTLYLFARRAAGGVSGLFSVTFGALGTVCAGMSPDVAQRVTFAQLLMTTLTSVTFPLVFEFAGSKVPVVGGLVAGRVERVLSRAIVERVLDDEDAAEVEAAADAKAAADANAAAIANAAAVANAAADFNAAAQDADASTEPAPDEDQAASGPSGAERLRAMAAKAKRYADKAEGVNQWVRSLVVRPFLGLFAFCLLLTFGPLLALVALELA